MRKVNYSLYMLPSVGKKPPHVSSWKMSASEAAGLGALYPIPGSAEPRDVPETEAERLAFYAGHPSAGRDGVKPPNP